MNSFRFTKMHGLGNSYIYVNQFEEQLPEERLAEIAVKVSSVYTGIGSDGMILICPSEKAPVKMRIFNNDGSEGKNCGNGLRCVAKYAYEHKLTEETSFFIETLSGLVKADITVDNGIVSEVAVDMGEPRLTKKELPMLGNEDERTINETFVFGETELSGTAVSMGNPHIVFPVADISQAPLTTLGPVIEKDPRFPEGINVEFVETVSADELHFRVWERGSGITQACGTGACAAAVASVLNGVSERNRDITVHLAGGDLVINWQDNGHVLMTGPAETVCSGVYYL
ncbi:MULTISPECIES: diaminopimelate epimerase [Bacillus]|jgi:diaminopimelate epimerase|uniref:Diaminopimelate epimerase n=1 Tax=Bacillus amyloliquefaciens (strain ATCC 23350 / DSM 7 / BCRC 11601 / CCUG 28519 / NBRC 15535 / NRRL B-14393 / F) TaxID=692420 RepID=A0A9P1JJ81_BACAS|nr:diaminopimelate epimerase [Bacillus amyloliquefaciens]AEB64825.1 diaminopimelate epimerase [Bacillus amyloliquefaciens LL3]ARW40409.1 Diaminopimelate epimerase [Bacillus amyloliquefaciens]AZV90507.1 diaminopimelate epimerase [Bacillus amyloliquefaciens]KYC99395.1 Diaminopimelate epimerase [Bacillus amyloliquefaciens]MBW8280773.1 diaminopimelate epimerase [Bacillus amyloliquefaciens]